MSNYDPYEILKISPDSSLHDIKQAYRHLVRIHHPDKNPNSHPSSENFLQIQLAFQSLSDHLERHHIDCSRLTADAVMQEEISIEDLEYVEHELESIFVYPCRCGGDYILDAVDFVSFKIQMGKQASLATAKPIFIYCESCSGACQVTF